MNVLLLPILVPIVAAAICLIAHRSEGIQRAISGIASHVMLGVSAYLLLRATSGERLVLHFGDWTDGMGIVFYLDAFAALMLGLAALIHVVTWWMSTVAAPPPEGQKSYFHPLFLLIGGGVSWAFLTGDLFNLFVSFELILLCTYVLLTDPSRLALLREAYRFLIVNAVAGTLFLMAAGLIYGAYGTLNLAELSWRVQTEPVSRGAIFGSFLLIVFGVKAAIFPLFTWLPRSYPGIPLSILPFLTGLLTKVGIYALYRIFPLVFVDSAPGWFQPLLLGIAGVTMLLGVLAALNQWSIREILSIHIISQIGYMIFGLALLTPLGLTGGILSIAHNIIVKTALFLVAAVVVLAYGTDKLKDLGGLLGKMPMTAGLFFLAAVSLAGIPPFSGFYSKWILTLEGFSGGFAVVTTAAVVTGLFTLASMMKIWVYAFWGQSRDEDSFPTRRNTRGAVGVTAALVGVSLLFILLSGPVTGLSELAARQLLDAPSYRAAVLHVEALAVEAQP